MPTFSSKKKTGFNISGVIDSTENVESLNAEKEYLKAKRKRRRNASLVPVAVILAELFVGVGLMGQIKDKDLQNRYAREMQIQRTGGIEFETGKYSGDTDFGIIKGVGEFDFDTGTVYRGDWDEGQFDGDGILTIPSEGEYVGEFSNSKKSGHGIFTWVDGSVYDGEWKNDKINGTGTYSSSDGIIYKGTFINNNFDTGDCDFENDTGS